MYSECKPNETIIERYKKMFESRISAGATENYRDGEKSQTETVACSYDMEGHAQKCVERYCELANKKVEQLKVSNPLDGHEFKHELDDLTFCGPSTSLRDQSQNGLRHLTDTWQG